MTGALTNLQPDKKKKVALIKPQSSGLVERCLVVGGGLAVVYTFAATLPIASAAALVAIGSYFWSEVKNFQPRETAEELTEILNAKTPKHPSINELKPTLKKQFPVDALNAAIESMLGDTAWIEFKGSDPHPLAPFGRVYCWINPENGKDVKLPLQRIEELFAAWGIIPTIEVQPAVTEAPSAPAIATVVDSSPNIAAPIPDVPLPSMPASEFTVPDAQEVEIPEPTTAGYGVLADALASALDHTPIASDQFLRDFAARPENILLIATKGGGKGIVLSNYLRMRKESDKNLQVLMIDPKSDDKEKGYWNEQWIRRYSFNAANCTLEELLEHLSRAFGWIAEICSNPALAEVPLLIVVDECLALSSILKKLGRTPIEKSQLSLKLELTSSLLDSAGRHLVAVTQSPNLGDIGISGGTALNFKKIILFRQDETDVIRKAQQTKLINLPSHVTDAYIKAVCDASPLDIKRGLLLNGEFHAMPKLKNYSGYDRDSRTYLSGHEPLPTAAESPPTAEAPEVEVVPDAEPESNDAGGERVSSPLADLLSYLDRKGGKNKEVAIAVVKQNWGKNKGYTTDQVEAMIGYLESIKKVERFFPPDSKAEWVRIAAPVYG